MAGPNKAECSQSKGEGPSVLVMPTRKRQGTWDQPGEKRQCVTEVAGERKHSPAAKTHDEGHGLHPSCAEGHSDGHHKGDGTHGEAGEKHSTVFLLVIFSGTAGVTAAFIQLGGEALGLEHVVDKRRMRGPTSKVDLCKKENQEMVLQWLDEKKIDGVMLAPPCGTSSRAREIPVFQSGKKRRAPQPLRNARYPNGLPTLRGLDALKVKLANKLYAFTRRVIDKCVRLGIPFVCENPLRSWMWSTSFFRQLHECCIFQVIHSCMYGGQRLKKTRFLMNFIADNLKRQCDGRHQHLPWGKTLSKETGQQVFSTSTEAEYPWQLCKQLALAFFQQMRQQGKVFEQNSPSMDVNQRMGAGTQPRGKLAPLLLSEF